MTPSQIRKLTSTISKSERKRTLGIIGLCIAGTILGVFLPFGILLIIACYVIMYKQRSKLRIDPLLVSSITWRWIGILLFVVGGTVMVVHPELVNYLQPPEEQLDSGMLTMARVVFAVLFYGASLLIWVGGYNKVIKYLRSTKIKGKSADDIFA